MQQPSSTPPQMGFAWDKVAAQYKGLGNLSILHAAEALRLLELTANDQFVLDVAAGAGAFAIQAAQHLKRLHVDKEAIKHPQVLATDLSEGMVAVCREMAREEGVGDVLESKVMDGQNLSEVQDSSVDVIGCVFGVMFFPDAVKGFREMHRVLRPGGRAAVVVWQHTSVGDVADELVNRLYATYSSQIEGVQPPTKMTIGYRFADPAFFGSQLEAGGFTSDNVRFIPYEADWGGLETNDAVINFMLDMPTTKSYFPPDQREAAAAVLREVIAERRASGQPWINKSLIALVRK